MSFDNMKVAELKQIAEDFAVPAENLKSKKDLIAALAEEGVTWSVYAKTQENLENPDFKEEIIPKFDPKQKLAPDTVLVRMTRANQRYDILGFTFTKDHPFVPMGQDKAQDIFDREEGFRLSTAKEVQDFYS